MNECKPLHCGAHRHVAHAGGGGVRAVRRSGARNGRAVQVDPIKPKLKPPGYTLLKLSHDGPASNFAFKYNSRRHIMAMITDDPEGGGETVMIHSTAPQLQVTSGKVGKGGKGGGKTGKSASGSRDQDSGSGDKRSGKSTRADEPEPENAPEDGALIIYTSGTTGQPKAGPGNCCPHTSSTRILYPLLSS